MDVPEIGTKFRHKDYGNKVFAFMSENQKGEVYYWSFIEVNSGKARYFHPEEVIEIHNKHVTKAKDAAKKRHPSMFKRDKPVLEGQEKVISIGGEEVTII